MFIHRVLPLPSPLTNTTCSKAQDTSRDSLLENSNMTGRECYGGSATMISPRRVSLRSSSPSKNRFPNTGWQESNESFRESALVVQGPNRSLRKRTMSQDPVGEIRHSERKLPPLQDSNILTTSADSASQVCLCQPDPKVPRPRNGQSSFS